MQQPVVLHNYLLFDARNEPDFTAKTEPWHGLQMLSRADVDYALFRLLAFADEEGMSMHHLAGAVEKYLKSILLGTTGASLRGRAGHDLVKLHQLAAGIYPELSDRTFRNFCWCLNPYSQLGRYPERILPEGGLALRANWNRWEMEGVREADLAAATLRAVAIQANGSYADTAWYLESLVHREGVLQSRDGVTGLVLEAIRTAMLSANEFFAEPTLPTFAQRFRDRRVYPLAPLPSERSTGAS